MKRSCTSHPIGRLHRVRLLAVAAVTAIGIGLVIVLSQASAAGASGQIGQGAEPGAVIRAWVEALNRGDSEAAIALYADDAVIDLFGKEVRGKPAIAQRQRGTIGPVLKPDLTIQNLEVAGDTVTLTLRGENSITRFDKHEPITNTIVFTVRDGLIVREVGPTLSPEDARWYAEAQQRFQAASVKPSSLPKSGDPGAIGAFGLSGLGLLGISLVAAGAVIGRRMGR